MWCIIKNERKIIHAHILSEVWVVHAVLRNGSYLPRLLRRAQNNLTELLPSDLPIPTAPLSRALSYLKRRKLYSVINELLWACPRQYRAQGSQFWTTSLLQNRRKEQESWMSKPTQAAMATGNQKVPPLSQSERLGKHCPWPEQNRQTAAAKRDSFNYSKQNGKQSKCFLQADSRGTLPGSEWATRNRTRSAS